jgi:hypothetical protein
VGGTSAGAPQWAALVAIADQGRALTGLGSLDGAQTLTSLYQMAESGSAAFFHPIGGSDYSAVTGLGSPIAGQIIDALASTHSLLSTQNAPASLNESPALTTPARPKGTSLSTPATAGPLFASSSAGFKAAPLAQAISPSAAQAIPASLTPAPAIPGPNWAPSSLIRSGGMAAAASTAEPDAAEAGIDQAQAAAPIWVSVSSANSPSVGLFTDRAFMSQPGSTAFDAQSSIDVEALSILMEESAGSGDESILESQHAPEVIFVCPESVAPQLDGVALASYCAAAAFVLSSPADGWFVTKRARVVFDAVAEKKKSKLKV